MENFCKRLQESLNEIAKDYDFEKEHKESVKETIIQMEVGVQLREEVISQMFILKIQQVILMKQARCL
jgi:hypothetical protein